MKKLLLIMFCFLTLNARTQEKLVILGKTPNQYVVHTAKKGESLQTISNQFGLSVAKLSSINKKAASSILKIGEKIKIPVTEFNRLTVKGKDKNAPLYHVTQKGENLYRISQTNKVPAASLKDWNSLKSDNLKKGQLIIIGFMVNAKTQTGNQKSEKLTATVSELPTADDKINVETKQAELPKKDINASQSVVIPVNSNPSVIPPSQVKIPPSKQSTQTPIVKSIMVTEALSPATKIEVLNEYLPKEGDEGFFANAYQEHGKQLEKQFHSGDAAIFKTISGWTDHKYYILMNDVAAETIVRITGPNNKSICAKVLGPLQETKGGSGLLLRMSNSAASSLGITDPKFTVTVTYFE